MGNYPEISIEINNNNMQKKVQMSMSSDEATKNDSKPIANSGMIINPNPSMSIARNSGMIIYQGGVAINNGEGIAVSGDNARISVNQPNVSTNGNSGDIYANNGNVSKNAPSNDQPPRDEPSLGESIIKIAKEAANLLK